MKAILEFDMEDPEDKQAHMCCIKASDLIMALWDIKQECYKGETIETETVTEIFMRHGIHLEELTS